MRFELGTKIQRVKGRFNFRPNLPEIYVGIEDGMYKVQFDFKFRKVEFQKEKGALQNCEILFVSTNFYEGDLIPKEGTEQVLCYPCGELYFTERGKKYKLEMEYLDMSFEKIQKHGHPENVAEVYLSVEEPYKGEICGYGGVHEPFAKKILAIKLIRL